ncbi:MAG: DUF3472 domain-containing protein [Lachnospiraceae bacterium]|nr:DUF3472 domain-containing protein [Lachnospiraceae bacterium]
MNKLKKVVLNCLLYMAVFSLTACGEKEVESLEIQENPTATPMVEENLSIGREEEITYINDLNGVNWDEILKVSTGEAKNEANPENRMAHNVYVDPDLSATSGKFDGFMIDFKADKAGMATYWSLCNWQMNKEDLMSKYDVIDAYTGAYAGLQVRQDGPKAIMSFWEIKYLDESGNEMKIEAERIYPSDGDTNKFGGEGEGTNYICDYKWEEEKWYRMYLNCYQDEDGKTFVEQWVADLSTGEWTLISCFDTKLYNSYFEGGMSQFMENYDYDYANETRTFEYRNICVREYGQKDWTTILTADLSVDTYWDNKKGKAFYGATEDRFYGIANGYGPDIFEKDEVVCDTFTIKPTKNPYDVE